MSVNFTKINTFSLRNKLRMFLYPKNAEIYNVCDILHSLHSPSKEDIGEMCFILQLPNIMWILSGLSAGFCLFYVWT